MKNLALVVSSISLIISCCSAGYWYWYAQYQRDYLCGSGRPVPTIMVNVVTDSINNYHTPGPALPTFLKVKTYNGGYIITKTIISNDLVDVMCTDSRDMASWESDLETNGGFMMLEIVQEGKHYIPGAGFWYYKLAWSTDSVKMKCAALHLLHQLNPAYPDYPFLVTK